jgi:hypothetical protein
LEPTARAVRAHGDVAQSAGRRSAPSAGAPHNVSSERAARQTVGVTRRSCARAPWATGAGVRRWSRFDVDAPPCAIAPIRGTAEGPAGPGPGRGGPKPTRSLSSRVTVRPWATRGSDMSRFALLALPRRCGPDGACRTGRRRAAELVAAARRRLRRARARAGLNTASAAIATVRFGAGPTRRLTLHAGAPGGLGARRWIGPVVDGPAGDPARPVDRRVRRQGCAVCEQTQVMAASVFDSRVSAVARRRRARRPRPSPARPPSLRPPAAPIPSRRLTR